MKYSVRLHYKFIESYTYLSSRKSSRKSSRSGSQSSAPWNLSNFEPKTAVEWRGLANALVDFVPPEQAKKAYMRQHTFQMIADLVSQHGDLHPRQSLGRFAEPVAAHLSTIAYLDHISSDYIYNTYSKLPGNRVCYISREVLRKVLERLMAGMDSGAGCVRYLSVIQDMKSNDTVIARSEYNSALVALYIRSEHKSAQEMCNTVLRWFREMQSSHCHADTATFNILLHMATETNQFQLLHSLTDEMRRLHLEPDRYTFVQLLQGYGRAGKEMTANKRQETIKQLFHMAINRKVKFDTVLLNSLLINMIRCGLLETAEELYQHSVAWHSHKKHSRTTRVQAYIDTKLHAKPDAATINLFLRFYCYRDGYEDSIQSMLDDAGRLGIRIDEAILLTLYQGFAFHASSNIRFWSLNHIEKWVAYTLRKAARNQIRLTRKLVFWMSKAYKKVNSTQDPLVLWSAVENIWRSQANCTEMEIEWVKCMLEQPKFDFIPIT